MTDAFIELLTFHILSYLNKLTVRRLRLIYDKKKTQSRWKVRK